MLILWEYFTMHFYVQEYVSALMQVYAAPDVIGSSGTGETDGRELPRGCWQLNHGPRQEQWALTPWV